MANADVQKSPKRLSMFLQGAFFDLVLVLVASTALVFTVSYGFDSAANLRGNIALTAVLCLLVLLPMYAGSWSKKALAAGIVGTVVVCVGVVAGFAAAMPAQTALFVDGQVNDVSDNYVIYAMVLVATPVVVYLLSRRTAGLFFLLVLGVVACGAVQFLYRDWITAQPGIPAFIAVLASMCMMFVYQTYRSSVYGAKRAKKPVFAQVFGFSALICAACVGIACAVFFVGINALGLSTPDIKPFKDYYQRPVVEYTGVYTEQQVDNLDLKTSTLSDEWKDTSQQGQGGNNVNTPDDLISSDPLTGLAQSLEGFDASQWAEQFTTVGYNVLEPQYVLLVALVLVAFVLFVLYWRRRRARRLEKWRELPSNEEAVAIYDFIQQRFKRLGVKKTAALTPLEHAMASRKELACFARNTGGVDLMQFTLLWQRAYYGGRELSAEQLAAMECYYQAFFGNAKAYSGKLKWALWRFWRI